MTMFARRFLVDNTGATAIEYGLIAALISIVCIGAFSRLGTNLQDRFDNVADAIGGATSQ
jgi:pilus assembly protein Flp/PilA